MRGVAGGGGLGARNWSARALLTDRGGRSRTPQRDHVPIGNGPPTLEAPGRRGAPRASLRRGEVLGQADVAAHRRRGRRRTCCRTTSARPRRRRTGPRRASPSRGCRGRRAGPSPKSVVLRTKTSATGRRRRRSRGSGRGCRRRRRCCCRWRRSARGRWCRRSWPTAAPTHCPRRGVGAQAVARAAPPARRSPPRRRRAVPAGRGRDGSARTGRERRVDARRRPPGCPRPRPRRRPGLRGGQGPDREQGRACTSSTTARTAAVTCRPRGPGRGDRTARSCGAGPAVVVVPASARGGGGGAHRPGERRPAGRGRSPPTTVHPDTPTSRRCGCDLRSRSWRPDPPTSSASGGFRVGRVPRSAPSMPPSSPRAARRHRERAACGDAVRRLARTWVQYWPAGALGARRRRRRLQAAVEEVGAVAGAGQPGVDDTGGRVVAEGDVLGRCAGVSTP